MPDEAALPAPERGERGMASLLRVTGALAVLVVGAVHLDQYFAVHYNVVPVIGPLFVLNFAGATLIGLGLLLPLSRVPIVRILLALGGIGLAATSFVFLFVSEHRPLFGFEEYGYRSAIIIALAAEALTVVSMAAYLAVRRRR
jgi:hypothetical protein